MGPLCYAGHDHPFQCFFVTFFARETEKSLDGLVLCAAQALIDVVRNDVDEGVQRAAVQSMAKACLEGEERTLGTLIWAAQTHKMTTVGDRPKPRVFPRQLSPEIMCLITCLMMSLLSV